MDKKNKDKLLKSIKEMKQSSKFTTKLLKRMINTPLTFQDGMCILTVMQEVLNVNIHVNPAGVGDPLFGAVSGSRFNN
jgi:hypothetical protein